MPNLDRLKQEAASILVSAGRGLVHGGLDDIEAVGEELAEDLIEAAATGNDELLELTVARVQLLGERQRLRANAAAWEAIQGIARAVFGLVKEALLP